jgi:hypothetical protein
VEKLSVQGAQNHPVFSGGDKMAKPNKSRADHIDGMDVVAWMQREGWIQSGMAPAPQRMKHLAAWYERRELDEEEHF